MARKENNMAKPQLVEDIMTPRPKYVKEGSNLQIAAEIMSANNIRALVVVDFQGHFLGILTEGSALAALRLIPDDELPNTVVDSYVVHYPNTVAKKDSIQKVLDIMLLQHLDHVVVVEDLRPIGIVSQHDIITKVMARKSGDT